MNVALEVKSVTERSLRAPAGTAVVYQAPTRGSMEYLRRGWVGEGVISVLEKAFSEAGTGTPARDAIPHAYRCGRTDSDKQKGEGTASRKPAP